MTGMDAAVETRRRERPSGGGSGAVRELTHSGAFHLACGHHRDGERHVLHVLDALLCRDDYHFELAARVVICLSVHRRNHD